jgi:hypothetical protein
MQKEKHDNYVYPADVCQQNLHTENRQSMQIAGSRF